MKTNVIHRTVVTKKAAGELAPGEFVVVSTVDLEALRPEESAIINIVDALSGVGGGRYESMVFKCDAEGKVANWSDLDSARTGHRPSVDSQHAAMVAKWSVS